MKECYLTSLKAIPLSKCFRQCMMGMSLSVNLAVIFDNVQKGGGVEGQTPVQKEPQSS